MDDNQVLGHPVTRAQLVDALLRLRPELASLGVTGISLFGSRARGDNRDTSDIDLIAEVDRTAKFSLLDLVAVEHLVADRLGLPASVFLRRSLDPAFQDSARRDEVVIFHG